MHILVGIMVFDCILIMWLCQHVLVCNFVNHFICTVSALAHLCMYRCYVVCEYIDEAKKILELYIDIIAIVGAFVSV